jgi:glycosyltransferase involved in cell wall biosynthesis
MGRVLIEAMGAGVPLVGSDVGGIPFMVRDGECGLVFPGGDSTGLEQKLRQLLADPALRRRLGDNGYRRAHQELNETVYVEQFTRMVEAAVRGEP